MTLPARALVCGEREFTKWINHRTRELSFLDLLWCIEAGLIGSLFLSVELFLSIPYTKSITINLILLLNFVTVKNVA